MTYDLRTAALPITRVLLIGIAPLSMAATVDARPPSVNADQTAAPASPPAASRKVDSTKMPMPMPHAHPHRSRLGTIDAPPFRTQPRDPRSRVGAANAAARVEPDRATWLNAIQQFPYADGALYQIYLSPGQVTDITLQEGEELVGAGPVAAGDTVRWIIGDTVSGLGAAKRVHVLVKPTRPDLTTNLVINTDRRTYHLELRATTGTYMAAVSWIYPQDQLIALRNASIAAERAAPVSSGLDIGALNFRYRIEGDRTPWRPVRAFDDGRQAYIEFPEGVATGEMPPLFVLGADGGAELVNYRVQGRYMVVDRLFGAAELRLGTKKTQQRVTIQREDASRRRRS